MRANYHVDNDLPPGSATTRRFETYLDPPWATQLTRLSSRSVHLFLALVLPMATVTRGASSDARPESGSGQARPDLIGQVAAHGGAIPNATIFIFTAGPKVGTSTFCPSCYADCRKSAKTDPQGDFKIESLDPQF